MCIRDRRWSIKESNSVYTSLLANYRVSCVADAGENAVYDIKEFFRVRIAGTTIYLLDYNCLLYTSACSPHADNMEQIKSLSHSSQPLSQVHNL